MNIIVVAGVFFVVSFGAFSVALHAIGFIY